MQIVIRHNQAGQWWWSALGASGGVTAVSAPYASRTDCLRAVAELKVEGPVAPISYDERNASSPGTWTIAGATAAS